MDKEILNGINNNLTSLFQKVVKLENENVALTSTLIDIQSRLKVLEDARKVQISINEKLLQKPQEVVEVRKAFWDIFS